MTSTMDVWQQLHALADQHLPGGAVPVLAGGLIGLGVLISVLGAKLARPGLALVFLGLGTSLASQFSDRLALPYPVLMVIGACVGGAVGYALYRLWVGVATGVLLACVAGMVMGHGHILSAIEELKQTTVAEFELQSPSVQAEHWGSSPREMAAELWHNIRAQSPATAGRIPVAATLAGLAGLLFGLFAARVAVILGTATLGTALLCLGTATLAQQFRPDVLDQLLGREGALILTVLGLLAASSLLQAHLTRRPRVPSDA
ncbi:MAG: hypothetical protein IID37_09875 [Planctomycetes bacterium]|nr:hypothetical protein [Planctomycetota bacterium]